MYTYIKAFWYTKKDFLSRKCLNEYNNNCRHLFIFNELDSKQLCSLIIDQYHSVICSYMHDSSWIFSVLCNQEFIDIDTLSTSRCTDSTSIVPVYGIHSWSYWFLPSFQPGAHSLLSISTKYISKSFVYQKALIRTFHTSFLTT